MHAMLICLSIQCQFLTQEWKMQTRTNTHVNVTNVPIFSSKAKTKTCVLSSNYCTLSMETVCL